MLLLWPEKTIRSIIPYPIIQYRDTVQWHDVHFCYDNTICKLCDGLAFPNKAWYQVKVLPSIILHGPNYHFTNGIFDEIEVVVKRKLYKMFLFVRCLMGWLRKILQCVLVVSYILLLQTLKLLLKSYFIVGIRANSKMH